MTAFPTGTVTLLFTDIAGSTRLFQHDSDGMGRMLARHDALIAECVAANGGTLVREQGEGDSTLSVFNWASDAAACALALQSTLRDEDWLPELTIRVRMALHSGEVVFEEDRYRGGTVIRGTGLRNLGHPQQVLLSDTTVRLLAGNLPADAYLKPLGLHQIKDISRPEQVYQLCHPGLPTDFPPSTGALTTPNNLPPQLTSFVGREDEVAAVRLALQSARLLTLVGVGGCGKTRLGIEVAQAALNDFPDGTWFVALASISDGERVARVISSALSVQEDPGLDVAASLLSYLSDKKCLLVLDNCEHVIESCAQVAHTILTRAPGVRVLATSRETLDVPGEASWHVPPLSLPDPAQPIGDDALERFAALRLFVDRARLRDTGFDLTPENTSDVAALCRRLDGLPLAIELAAARANVLSPTEVLARLDRRLDLLSAGPKTVASRHQTLRAAIDWSHDLLDPLERSLFARLAVFPASFDLNAVEAVCAYDGLGAREILSVIDGLVTKSMLDFTYNTPGGARYRMLESLRDYARERLDELEGPETVSGRHMTYYLGFARQAGSALEGADQGLWLDRLDAERDNLRLAFVAAQSTGEITKGLEAAYKTWPFWHARGSIGEGRALIEELLALADDSADRAVLAAAHRTVGTLAYYQGDMSAARRHTERSADIERTIGVTDGLSRTLNNLALICTAQFDHAAARALYEECLLVDRSLGDESRVATTLANITITARAQGDLDVARECCEESLRIARNTGDDEQTSMCLLLLGILSVDEGNPADALPLVHESMAIREDLGHRWGVAECLVWVGHVAVHQGDLASARAPLEQSLAISEDLDDAWGVRDAESELAALDYFEVDIAGAKERYSRVLTMAEAHEHHKDVGTATRGLGRVAFREGDLARAWTLLAQSFAMARDVGGDRLAVTSLESMICVAQAAGDDAVALELAGVAAALRWSGGEPNPLPQQEQIDACIVRARRALTDAEAEAVWARGQAIPPDGIVERLTELTPAFVVGGV